MAGDHETESRRDYDGSATRYSENSNKRQRSASPNRRDDRRQEDYRDDRRGGGREDYRDGRRDGHRDDRQGGRGDERDNYRDERRDERRDEHRDDRQPKRRLQSYASQRDGGGYDRRDHREDNNDDYNRRANDELPQPFDAKALERAKKRARSRSPGGAGSNASPSAGGSGSGGADQARKPKRPGQRARITDSEREAIRQRALERERHAKEELERQQKRAMIDDVVRSHYNAVPERGREWRKTASTIKGLRSMNNWVKSCIIQKFSPDEDFEERTSSGVGGYGGHELLVLDIGCGKGGDLGKWNLAPQKVQLYVGLDPADVSIDQARDRYREMAQRGSGGRGGRGGYSHNRPPPRIFDARFMVKDCFGESIGDINIVQDVGFDSNPLSRKGFDVVSMMFCMHYAFETEQKARMMLKNVACALKKGGRFIGCIPNSDVLGNQVERYHILQEELKKRNQEKKQEEKGEQDDKEKDGVSGAETAKAEAVAGSAKDGEAKPGGETEAGEVKVDVPKTAEWGNGIYRVRFPGDTPADGVFRPPFGWKYNFFLNEAVEEVPEYVVPWHAFRALAEDYNLELQYHKTFPEVWESEKDDRTLGPLSERMGVRDRNTGELLVSKEEMEAAGFYVAFCFYKV